MLFGIGSVSINRLSLAQPAFGASRKGPGLTLPQHIRQVERKQPAMQHYLSTPLKEWVSQFRTTEEKHLALKLVENLRFFDQDDIRQGTRQLHQWLLQQPGFSLDRAKFSHVAVGKSGGMIHYYYRSSNQLPNQSGMEFSMAGSPTQFDPGKPIDTLVILDDFMGTAREIDYFLNKMKTELQQYKKIYFLTLVGYPEGGDIIKAQHPEVTYKALEVHHKLFSPENSNFTAEEKDKLKALLMKYGEPLYPAPKFGPTATPFGYRDGQSLVSFFYNTPSNAFPVLWSAENGWKPLLQRYDSFNVPFYPAPKKPQFAGLLQATYLKRPT